MPRFLSQSFRGEPSTNGILPRSAASNSTTDCSTACTPAGSLNDGLAGFVRSTTVARATKASPFRSAIVGLALAGAACSASSNGPRPLSQPVGEPVVIGYATVTKGMPMGAAESLAAERLHAMRATRIEDLLSGRPGLSVSRRPDGRVSLRIRGPNSFIGDGEPLLVLDGIPVEYDTGGLLRGISPSDIVRIEVLKDGASTAIFGVRGGNGVVMITTRRAR